MIDIIPNWHPIFVHYTVALLSLAVGFYVVNPWLSEGKIKQQLYIMARWNLYLGTGFGIVTAIAGWFAYNSVAHDGPSHAAMTEHRNWALVTISLFTLLTIRSFWFERNKRLPTKLFLMSLIIGGLLLTSTAWHGAEAVYRYGLGVMSLPQVDGEGHSHEHGKGEAHALNETKQAEETQIHNKPDGHSGHQHADDPSMPAAEEVGIESRTESDTTKSIQEPTVEKIDNHSGHEH